LLNSDELKAWALGSGKIPKNSFHKKISEVWLDNPMNHCWS